MTAMYFVGAFKYFGLNLTTFILGVVDKISNIFKEKPIPNYINYCQDKKYQISKA